MVNAPAHVQATTVPPHHPAPAADADAATATWRGLVRILVRLLLTGMLVTLVLAVVYPLLWMLLSSFKDNTEVFGNPWGLPSQLRWHNFSEALRTGVLRYSSTACW